MFWFYAKIIKNLFENKKNERMFEEVSKVLGVPTLRLCSG